LLSNAVGVDGAGAAGAAGASPAALRLRAPAPGVCVSVRILCSTRTAARVHGGASARRR